MLYDILAPLIFLASLGGIIWIISRVLARGRRSQLSQSISAAAEQDLAHSTTKIQPQQSRIHLLENRGQWIGALFSRVKSGIPQLLVRARQSGRLAGQPFQAVQKAYAARRQAKIERAQEQAVAAPPAPVIKPTMTLRRIEEMPTEEKKEPAEPTTLTGKRVTSPSFFRKKPAVSALEQAEQAIAKAQYDAAETILVPYIFKHAKDTLAYMLLGRVAVARANWNEAAEIFEEVIKYNPGEAGAWAALGEAAYKCGHFTRALQALQRAHEADGENKKVLEYLLAIAQKMDNRGLQQSIKEKIAVFTQSGAVRV